MSVTLAILLFLAICFFFGSSNFFLAMCIFAGFFALVEIAWKLVYGHTISAMFWAWSELADKWKVYTVMGAMVSLAIFLAGHLIWGW